VVEADETPRDAAIREVREELGLEIRLGRPLVIDHLTAQATADTLVPDLLSAGRITEEQAEQAASVLTGVGLYWVFDGGLVTQAEVDAITVDGGEIRTVRLVDADASVSSRGTRWPAGCSSRWMR
jgi:8-oxo-dGTP pyrophosphatase MutT (NUDIX family)